MSKRDTVIIAILANFALLIILFSTSSSSISELKKTDVIQNVVSNSADENTNIVISLEPVKGAKSNELLQQFMQAASGSNVVNNKKEIEEVRSFINISAEQDTKKQDSKCLQEAPSCEAPVASVIDESGFVNVVVKKGDFLEKIAKANCTSVAMIMRINKLNSTQLKIGQVLKIPAAEVKISESFEYKNSDNFYTVKDGDSPWSIAIRHKMKLEDLLRLNDLDEQKARKLRPGDQLRTK